MQKRDLYKIIGKNIQKERLKQGLTQETFAELMDVSWSYVAKMESGILNLSLGKVFEISEFLKIDINILLEVSVN